MLRTLGLAAISVLSLATSAIATDLAVRGGVVHTAAGDAINDGIVLIDEGKITAVGPAADVDVPEGTKVVEAAVVVPGFVDARTTLGLTGINNQPGDQDQLDDSGAIQPELRAIDAYNPQDPLVKYMREFGTTTVHTGHAPGALISGQTAIIKTIGNTVGDATVDEATMIAATIGDGARRSSSPGTRGKMLSMLRQQLIKARDYRAKMDKTAEGDEEGEGEDKAPAGRDLKMEMMVKVLNKEMPLMIHADRAQDIASALRLAEEFGFDLVLESGAESYLLLDEIKASGIRVIVHPLMQRPVGQAENLSFETPSKLKAAGIPIAFQTGFEGYVPKVRVLLFEAQVAAANGMSFADTLASMTIDAATLLGVDDRVGSLEVGKDADLALFDGDPFEYTTHCVGTIIDGQLVNEESN